MDYKTRYQNQVRINDDLREQIDSLRREYSALAAEYALYKESVKDKVDTCGRLESEFQAAIADAKSAKHQYSELNRIIKSTISELLK